MESTPATVPLRIRSAALPKIGVSTPVLGEVTVEPVLDVLPDLLLVVPVVAEVVFVEPDLLLVVEEVEFIVVSIEASELSKPGKTVICFNCGFVVFIVSDVIS